MMKKFLIIVLLISLVSFQSQATIEYKLRYNTAADVFEVSFVSTVSYGAGAANIGPSQATILFDASFNTTTLVASVPINGGAWLPQDKTTGTTGTVTGKKVVAFSTIGAPIATGVVAGTEYKLFSFTFGTGQNCNGGTFRLLNTTDPTDPDGQGGDFTSYLNIGENDEISTNTGATFQTCESAGPTPVKFLNFSAVKNENTALLNWSVANEDALTKTYIVERSINRVYFEQIASIPAKNNGVAVYNDIYDLTDKNLSALHSSGIIFYRIKQVDADGDFVYSEIKALRLNSKDFGLLLYPNPAKNYANITIDLNAASDITINVSDAAGKQITKILMPGFKGTNIKRVDLSGLAAGSYLFKVYAGGQFQTIGLVKGE